MSKEKVLFRENGWLLVRSSTISDQDRTRCFSYSDNFQFESVIKHMCPLDGVVTNDNSTPMDTRNTPPGEMSYLDEEDSMTGTCWWCMTDIPPGLNALWRLQNWDFLLKVHISQTWDPDEVVSRKKDIEHIKAGMKKGTWDGTGSRGEWRKDNAGE